jgi:glycosyltransferase involved in cell wall biosynthesis
LGRTARDKHYDDIINAMRLALERGAHATLRIAGPSLSADDSVFRAELHDMIAAYGLGDAVRLDGPVERPMVSRALAEADVLVNAAEFGNADKIVFEAMACRRPVLVSTPIFDPLLSGSPVALRVPPGDPGELARRIIELEQLPAESLRALGEGLRNGVVEGHSLEHWSASLVDIAEELHRRRRRSTAA